MPAPGGREVGTLRGRPANLKHGDRMLVVFVEKWGFKEGAMSFREPQVAMSVRDQDGESVETVQVSFGEIDMWRRAYFKYINEFPS